MGPGAGVVARGAFANPPPVGEITARAKQLGNPVEDEFAEARERETSGYPERFTHSHASADAWL